MVRISGESTQALFPVRSMGGFILRPINEEDIQMRGQGKQKVEKEILSSSEINDLKSEKQDLEGIIRESEQGAGEGTSRGIDKAAIQGRMAHIDRLITEGTPDRIVGVSKDRAHNEAKELAEKIKEGMPTRDEMMRPQANPGAIDKHMAWEKANGERIARYKHLQRQLNPQDPRAGSIETLRSR